MFRKLSKFHILAPAPAPVIVICLLILGTIGVAYASPLYTPGQTLDPDCLPTNPDCTVSTSTALGIIGVGNGGTGWGVFTIGNLLYGNGTSALATSSNLTFNGTTLTANALSLGSLSGLLFGTNGTVGTISTSTLNINTNNLIEGTNNLFFTAARASTTAIAVIAATTSLPNLTTLTGLTSAMNLSSVGSLTSGSIGVGFGNINIGTNVFTGVGSGLTALNASNITAGLLAAAYGGTGASSFSQGWIYSNGGTGALAASTSPTVNRLIATSTSLASIFPYASTTALTVSDTAYFGTASTTNAYISNIASSSVLFAGAGGLLRGSSNLTFDGTTLTMPTTTVTGLLTLATSTNSSLFQNTDIAAWGDSITQGTSGNGSTATTSWPAQLASLSGFGVFNGGESGQTATQIAARMAYTPEELNKPTIIWAGRNYAGDWNTTNQAAAITSVTTDVQNMINSLASPKKFIVFSITNRNCLDFASICSAGGYGSESTSTTALTNMLAVNAALKSLAISNGGQYFDMRGYLVSLGTPTEKAADVMPGNLMYDSLHPNTAGNAVIAQYIKNNLLSYLVGSTTQNGSVVTYSELNSILASPQIIGSRQPSGGYFKTIVIGASTTPNLTGVNYETNPQSFLTIQGMRMVPGDTFNTDRAYSLNTVTALPEIKLLDSYGMTSNEFRAPLASLNDTFIGVNAGYNITTGNDNVALGWNAANQLQTGQFNIVIGSGAGVGITTGSFNDIIGDQGGVNIGAATQNVCIGHGCLYAATGNGNVGIGVDSGFYNAGTSNTFIGNTAGFNSTGVSYSTVIGAGVYAANSGADVLCSNCMLLGGTTATNYEKVGIATSSPYAMMSVEGLSGGTTPLFAIGTTTNGTTYNTPFQIDQNGLLTMNTPGATSTITGNLRVVGGFRANNTYTGDLFFGNNWRITEAPIDGTPQGLILKNQNDTTALSIDENGNMTVNGDVCSNGAQCFGKSISYLTNDVNAIASSTALSILSATAQTGQSLSEISASLASASQSIALISAQVDALASTTALIQSAISTSTLASTTASVLVADQSFVQSVADAVFAFMQSSGQLVSSTATWAVNEIHATLAVFTRVETQTAAISNGLEMTSPDGQVWCVRIDDLGGFQRVSGTCSATSTAPVANQTPSANVQEPSNNQVPTVNDQATSSASSTSTLTAMTTGVITIATSSMPTAPTSTTPLSMTVASSTDIVPTTTPVSPPSTSGNNLSSSTSSSSAVESSGSTTTTSMTTPPPSDSSASSTDSGSGSSLGQ